jgi:hypothetical protein
MPVLFVLGCGQDRPAGKSVAALPASDHPAGGPSEVTSSAPVRPKSSKIAIDTWGCRTIEMFDSLFKTIADKKPLPAGCFDLDLLTRVKGPFDLKTIKRGNSDSTYALIEVPQKGRLWVYQNHIEVFPDSVKPVPLGQALRVTAEEFVREYNDAQYLDEQVIVTGIAHSANFQVIEMQSAHSIILEFCSSGSAGIADFPPVRKGQKLTIKGKCLGGGKDKQRFIFENSSIVSAANKQD